MGRKRKPNALHELAGLPGKRDLPEEPNLPLANEWTIPDYLRDDGLTEWNRVVPMLRACKVLSDSDYQTVVAYCLVVQEMAALARAGEPIRGTTFTHFRSLAAELGLTPASRAKVQIIKDEPASDDAFFAIG